MRSQQSIFMMAAIALLSLAALAIVRGRGPLKIPLILLCLDVAGWSAASSTYAVYGTVALSGIDHVLTPLTSPLALDFTLAFVGALRASHLTRFAAFILCGALSVASLVAFVIPSLRPFVDSRAWGVWLLASSVPTMAVGLTTLIRHRQLTTDPEERMRTSFLLVVFGIGTLFGSTEVIASYVPSCPQLGSVGMLACAIGLGIVTIRFRLLELVVPWRFVVGLIAGACLIATACWNIIHAGGAPRQVALVLVIVVLALALISLLRERVTARILRADRTSQLATLGRFTAQMDHDVRNPLSALKGAAQLLRRDLSRAEPAIDRGDFIALIIDQAERIERICDRYRRLSRLDLNRAEIDINQIVRAVLSRQAPTLPPKVTITSRLSPELPLCWADADLLATVLENLTRNAVEAMPEGGTLTVQSTARAASRAAIELSVEDTGFGMDARTRERAADDFFTTKASGSGFGLAFAKRVTEAHGGRMSIASDPGRGTRIKLWIPAQRAE
jgi:two-component system sensor histidine kinase HydH